MCGGGFSLLEWYCVYSAKRSGRRFLSLVSASPRRGDNWERSIAKEKQER